MNARFLFNTSAIAEILTGLALLVIPALVIRLLLGDGLGQTGEVVSRVLGIGLFSLGISAWETVGQRVHLASRAGIFIYNIGLAILLLILGVPGVIDGILLWPVAVLHGLIGAAMLWVILARSWKVSDT